MSSNLQSNPTIIQSHQSQPQLQQSAIRANGESNWSTPSSAHLSQGTRLQDEVGGVGSSLSGRVDIGEIVEHDPLAKVINRDLGQ